MKFLALGLAALMSFSAPVGVAHAFNGENADAAQKFERPAICQKADGFLGSFRFDGERAAEWREKFELTNEEKAEKLDGMTDLTEEEKAEIKEKVQSFFAEKEFAGKPKIPGNVGRGKLGKFRPSFGTNDQ